MEKKLNIKDMAKKAGVSVATISRALHPDTRDKVAPTTLKKIDALIEKFSYTPSLAAKNLRRSSTKTIGVIFPYVNNIFYSTYYTHILSGVSNFLMDTGYQFKILLLREGANQKYQYDFKVGEGVDGLIVTQWFRFFTREFMTKRMNVPCVVINDFEKDIKTKFVYANHYSGGEIAAEYLYDMGHRRIAVIAGPVWSKDSVQRVKGFKAGLKKLGATLDPGLIVHGDYDDGTETNRGVDKILGRDPKVTAIFCCNDNMAFMAIERLNSLGISCPKDISVMGYDDDFRAPVFSPALTTIHVPVYELANEAARGLIDCLKGGEVSSSASLVGKAGLPVNLVKRSSVKKLK